MAHTPPTDLRSAGWSSQDIRTLGEPPRSPFASEAERELSQWWMDLAQDEIQRTVPKAIEYSSTDLADIGHDLARTAGRAVSDEEAMELGIFFYIRGKLARWSGAIISGQRPSDDTIADLAIYTRMAQRVRHSGGWPGTETNLEGAAK